MYREQSIIIVKPETSLAKKLYTNVRRYENRLSRSYDSFNFIEKLYFWFKCRSIIKAATKRSLTGKDKLQVKIILGFGAAIEDRMREYGFNTAIIKNYNNKDDLTIYWDKIKDE